jgi:hypothetical protein
MDMVTPSPWRQQSMLRLPNSQTPFGAPVAPAASAAPIGLDTDKLDAAIGAKGKVNDGVYQFSVPRQERITEDGMPIPPAMGTAIAINFQPTGGGKAAITGDFVVTAEELNPMDSRPARERHRGDRYSQSHAR